MKLMKSHVGMLQEYQNLNILNFEMESGTLFKMANVYGLHATSICAVAAILIKMKLCNMIVYNFLSMLVLKQRLILLKIFRKTIAIVSLIVKNSF